MWLYISRYLAITKNTKTLHLAPELGIIRAIDGAGCDTNYVVADLDPARYASTTCEVRKLDLCGGLKIFPDETFDLILHNHVLEHLQCDVDEVLKDFFRILKPGAQMVFSVPIRGEQTIEDEGFKFSGQERAKRFGQWDHVRIFGENDIASRTAAIFENEMVRANTLFSDLELKEAGIPLKQNTEICSHSILILEKRVAAIKSV